MSFQDIVKESRKVLLLSHTVDVGEWHSQSTGDNPKLVTMEIPFYSFVWKLPPNPDTLSFFLRPNMPWAEDHFRERVSGVPMNPAPSHRWWPWNHDRHHDENEVFSHTYPERFWPVFANEGGKCADSERVIAVPHVGIRYEWGDLGDVVNLLRKNKYTRQAVLPIFFPEDTGNKSGVRIPCSLHYQFFYRDDALHMKYSMRSCDFVRHFKDDIYLAARLLAWMATGLEEPAGQLHVDITSLHAMEGDRWKMTEEMKNGEW